MLRLLKLCVVAFATLTLSTSVSAQETSDTDKTAKQILDEALDQNGVGFVGGVAKLKLTVKKGKREDVTEMVVLTKKSGDITKTKLTLTAPSDAAGEAYLFLGDPDGEDDVYMFLPAFRETRKVSGTDKTGSFLGSHISFRDLESRDFEGGTSKRLEDEKIGKHDCYVIEATPPEGEKTEYARSVMWVRKSDYMPLRIRFFNAKDEQVKQIFSEKISTSKSGVTYVKTLSVHPESGGSTKLEILEADFEADVPDATFNKNTLGE